jgi:long-chain acyl-CoA synthetase
MLNDLEGDSSAVAVPTNIVYRERELLHAVEDAGAVAVITDTEGVGVVHAIRDAAPGLAHVIVVGGNGEEETGWEAFEEPPAGMRPAHCGFDDLCQIQYTAGTTGRPKGAMLTHGNWTSALDAEVEALALGPSDVYLGIYPMGHVGVSWDSRPSGPVAPGS